MNTKTDGKLEPSLKKGSALDRIEARVSDLGDSEASRCIREVCRELRACRAALDRIRRFPVHSEPVGGAYAMQDIAHEALIRNVGYEP